MPFEILFFYIRDMFDPVKFMINYYTKILVTLFKTQVSTIIFALWKSWKKVLCVLRDNLSDFIQVESKSNSVFID